MDRSWTLTLSVALRELDFDLPSADPFPVQAVKSVLCVTHILKYAEWLRFLFALVCVCKTTQIKMNVLLFENIKKTSMQLCTLSFSH